MKTRTQTAIVTCPDCGERIRLRGVIQIDHRVICPNCETDLKVVALYPIELDWVDEDVVDWDARW
jgi:lysine biosynthesis protein LysW